jgi:hypothetical protein
MGDLGEEEASCRCDERDEECQPELGPVERLPHESLRAGDACKLSLFALRRGVVVTLLAAEAAGAFVALLGVA